MFPCIGSNRVFDQALWFRRRVRSGQLQTTADPGPDLAGQPGLAGARRVVVLVSPARRFRNHGLFHLVQPMLIHFDCARRSQQAVVEQVPLHGVPEPQAIFVQYEGLGYITLAAKYVKMRAHRGAFFIA